MDLTIDSPHVYGESPWVAQLTQGQILFPPAIGLFLFVTFRCI